MSKSMSYPSNSEYFIKPNNNDSEILGCKIRNSKHLTEIVPLQILK